MQKANRTLIITSVLCRKLKLCCEHFHWFHLNWHSFVIKFNMFSCFFLHGELYGRLIELFGWKMSSSNRATELSRVTSKAHDEVSRIPFSTSNTTHFRLLSIKFSVFLDFSLSSSDPTFFSFFFLFFRFFSFLFGYGEWGEKISKEKLYPTSEKCVIYNYSFSNPVRLLVAEPQLDSSYCKLIE